MDEGRLGAVRRQQNHHRKSTIVMNDIINFQQNVYTCYLKRERQNTEAKMKAQEVFLKRSIARNSYLLQCLEARKQKIAERAPEKQILGRYGGRPINAFSRDVDACIAWRHPRLRRLRRVERAKEKGLKIGAIMDFATIPDKMEAILNKGQEKDDSTSASKDSMMNLPSLTTSKLRHSLAIRNQSMGVPNILKIQHALYSHNRPIEESLHESRDESTEVVKESTTDKNTEKETPDKDIITISRNSHDDVTVSNDEHGPLDSKGTNTKDKENRKSPVQETDIILNVNEKLTKNKNESKSDVITSTAITSDSPSPISRRPTLILPPIKTTKDMKIRGFDAL